MARETGNTAAGIHGKLWSFSLLGKKHQVAHEKSLFPHELSLLPGSPRKHPYQK